MDSQNKVFIGSTTGIIKGISVRNDTLGIKVRIKNYVNTSISNNDEIYCMSWFDENQNDVLVGKKNGIKIYNINDNAMNDVLVGPEYSVRGIFNHEGILVFGTVTGVVRFWKYPYEKNRWEQLNVGSDLSRIKRSVSSSNVFATGGKENDLKLWDSVTKQCIFQAKNIKPDNLQLRVPVWISDICFSKNSEKIAYCSRHGHVRLFDPLLPQRRPTNNIHLPGEVFTCISTTPDENTFLVGSGSGNLHLVDIRGKNDFVGKYKGFSGAVKDVTCSAENNSLVFSVSLDRHFRIHDFRSRKLLTKEYTQSRLTSVLIRNDFVLNDKPSIKNAKNSTEEKNEREVRRNKRKHINANSLEEVFENLETIREVLNMNDNDQQNNTYNDRDDYVSNDGVCKRNSRRT